MDIEDVKDSDTPVSEPSPRRILKKHDTVFVKVAGSVPYQAEVISDDGDLVYVNMKMSATESAVSAIPYENIIFPTDKPKVAPLIPQAEIPVAPADIPEVKGSGDDPEVTPIR